MGEGDGRCRHRGGLSAPMPTPPAAKAAAREAKGHPALEQAVRLGLVAYGVVHLLIGWLALRLATGSGGEPADQNGALQELAGTPFGRGLLWVLVAGFVALVIWQVIEVVLGSGSRDGLGRTKDRAAHALKIAIFGALAITAAQVAAGGGSGGGDREESWTAQVMQWSIGPALVGIGGLVIAGYGVMHAYRGWKEKFREQLRADATTGTTGEAIVKIGKVGYIAKGIALTIVGGLFITAAIEHDPQEAGGLDDALSTLAGSTLGAILLAFIAAGLACYGAYCFARARYVRT